MDQIEKRELITGIIFICEQEKKKLMKGEQYYLKRFSFLKRRYFRTIFFGKKNFVKRVEIFLNEYS
jgi:hypothetical protein